MKITTFVVRLPEGVTLEHLYNSFLAHDTLLHYHRALARNDIVAYGPFELASPKEVDEETAVAGMKAVAAAAAAAAASSSSSSTPASASAALPETWDPALPFFKRKASVLMPLAAPRPLQMAVGTSVIKLRLRQSVAVLRRAKVFDDDDDDDGNDKQRLSGVEAPLDLIEFRSAPRLWVPGSRDQSLGRTSMLASYEEIVDGDDDGKKKADGGGGVIAAAEEREVPAPVAAELTPLHLSPRRLRSRSASLAGEVAAPNSPPPIRQRVRIDVTATADFNPEGWMATFKRPLESVMLTMQMKSARGMANWFGACAASDAGVGPLFPDLSTMPELVAPRLPKELIYLETRRISLDGPPGLSRGLTVEESQELMDHAAKGSERASEVAAAAAAVAAAAVAAEVAAESSGKRGKKGVSSKSTKAFSKTAAAASPVAAAVPAVPASSDEPVTPEREIGGALSLSRVSLASSVESFHSAASELAERVSSFSALSDDGEGEKEESSSSSPSAPPSSSLFPATPARSSRAPAADGKVTVSTTPSSVKRVLRMPRWLVPGGSGNGNGSGTGAPPRRSRSSASLSEQANETSSSSSSSSSSRPKSAPGGSFNEREQQQRLAQQQQQQQSARKPVLAWLRPKSAKA